MAEMTASEARIFILQQLKELSGPEGCCVQTMQRNQTKRNNLRALAALIQQQQRQIEAQAREIEGLKHPKCYCRSCCEKRGEIYLEDLYTEEAEVQE